MNQKTANDFSTKSPPIQTIRFDVFDILELMAKEDVLATNEKIVKASQASARGVLTKFGVSKEQMEQFSKKLDDSISDILEETFIEELSTRFTAEDFIILNFFEDYVELSLSDVFAKTTDDIEALFRVIFIRKIDEVIMLDSLKVTCNNCTLISELAKGISSPAASTETVKLVCKGFPFYFVKEDFENKNFFSNKFKQLKKIRTI